MVAQNQLIFSILSGHVRQRGRGFGVLAQTFGRTAIPFIKKDITPAATRIEANLFEIAAQEVREVVSGSKKFKTSIDLGTKAVWKYSGDGNKSKRINSRIRSISQKIGRKTVALVKTLLTKK